MTALEIFLTIANIALIGLYIYFAHRAMKEGDPVTVGFCGLIAMIKIFTIAYVLGAMR